MDCPRCEYKTTRTSDFKKHINRKHVCKPIKSNVSLIELREIYKHEKEINNICEKCHKGFTSRSGYANHIKKCKILKPTFSMTNSITTIESKIECMCKYLHDISLKQNVMSFNIDRILVILGSKNINDLQLDRAKSISPSLPMITESIDIKDFGQEDITHVIENVNFMKSCFLNNEEGIKSFIGVLWFDKNYLQNMNLRVISNNEIEYYQYKSWHRANWKPFLRTLLNYTGSYYQEFLEKLPIFDKKFLDNYMRKIGIVFEWDFSHEGYDFDLPENISETAECEEKRDKIYKLVKDEIIRITQN